MKRIALIIIFLLITPNAYANVDMAKISMIESSNNPKAYNASSKARGLYQITPICLKDFNDYHPNNQYTLEQLYDASINTIIAKWYLDVRIPQMLRHFKKEVTIENILFAYNAGIGKVIKGIMPEETRKYIGKYSKITRG